MKRFNYAMTILFMGILFMSCDNNTKENKSIIAESVKTAKNINKSEDFRERLKATEPATEAQFKDWLPSNIAGIERTEFSKIRGSQSDIATAGAIYENESKTKKLEITIADGASRDGLLAIQSHYMAQTLELNNTKPSRYEKTYEKNGLKILETYVKKDEFYRVSFLYDMRFGITIESNGLDYDEVWQAIAALNLKKLNKL
jgi:hypothetical protein